jgi:hypothetical protein
VDDVVPSDSGDVGARDRVRGHNENYLKKFVI